MKKKEIIHRTRLFGGVKTAEEIHREYGFRSRCLKCQGPPTVQIRMFMEHDEFVQRCPEMAVAIAASNPTGNHIPCVPMTFGKMVKYATVTACRHHQKELELEAAKAPSFVLVEVDYGPGADRPVIQVPEAATTH
jgi:hypothetical protein